MRATQRHELCDRGRQKRRANDQTDTEQLDASEDIVLAGKSEAGLIEDRHRGIAADLSIQRCDGSACSDREGPDRSSDVELSELTGESDDGRHVSGQRVRRSADGVQRRTNSNMWKISRLSTARDVTNVTMAK